MTTHRTPVDWALFAAVTLIWASAYAFTRIAVSQSDPASGFPPQFIIPARLTLGGIILLCVAFISRQKWPALNAWKSWLAMAVMGIVGTAAPFFVITTAQQTVDSSLAALYVAASPLFVSVLAHALFHDDQMTKGKALGLAVGFMGVAVLFGPEAITAFGSTSMTAQALCLLGTVFYAISTITARYARDIPPFVFSAGFISIGAVATWPLLMSVNFDMLAPSTTAILGVIGLGIGPTAMASVLYMVLIKRTSATFLSLTGYTIPIVSAIIGYFAFHEVQDWNAALAFALILLGVWLAQRGTKTAQPVTD